MRLNLLSLDTARNCQIHRARSGGGRGRSCFEAGGIKGIYRDAGDLSGVQAHWAAPYPNSNDEIKDEAVLIRHRVR